MYAHVYVCTSVCIHVRTSVRVHVYTCVRVYVNAHVYVCMCARVYVVVYVGTWLWHASRWDWRACVIAKKSSAWTCQHVHVCANRSGCATRPIDMNVNCVWFT